MANEFALKLLFHSLRPMYLWRNLSSPSFIYIYTTNMPPRAFVRWLVGGNNKVMLQELFLRFASFAEIKLSNTCEFEIIGSAFERFHLFSAPKHPKDDRLLRRRLFIIHKFLINNAYINLIPRNFVSEYYFNDKVNRKITFTFQIQ